jgi:hypothetical protein
MLEEFTAVHPGAIDLASICKLLTGAFEFSCAMETLDASLP